jgi:hypothetical protein
MALDKKNLQKQIHAAFKKAQETPPPNDPKDSDTVQKQILIELAQDIANAIDSFVRSGAVVGITTHVILDIPNETGTGKQTGPGSIK